METKLEDRIDATGCCWEWVGTRNAYGYGTLSGRLGHRLVWEDLVGPIPEGLDLDHLCRVRHCVNPDHLEPVTRAENLRRGVPGRRRRLSECKRGHAMVPENVYTPPGTNKRECKECQRERVRSYRARRNR